MSVNELLIIPSNKIQKFEDGKLITQSRYLSALEQYVQHWPGKVTTLFEVNNKPSIEMDDIEVNIADISSNFELLPKDFNELSARLSKASLVFAFLSGENVKLANYAENLKSLLFIIVTILL